MKDRIYAIIVAGGTGSRMGSSVPKQYLELCDKRILQYSVEKFLDNPSVDACIIVAADMYHEKIAKTLQGLSRYKDIYIVTNGDERIDSVRNGLKEVQRIELECGQNSDCNAYVMIHDGARPLISHELIMNCMKNVKEHKAIIPAISVKDTVKIINDNYAIVDTPVRSTLRAAQTPQCFELGLILSAYDNYDANNIVESIPTDDASLIEIYTDKEVFVINGDEHNLKITTPIDLKIAEMIIKDNL